MKYKLVAFWLIVFGALFAFLQMCFEYHFYYIEQSQLFLFSEAYIRNKLLLPGGFSMLVAEFLVQFFIRPYVGALVTAVLLTGVGVCTAGIVKRIAPVSGLFILYVLPMLALLFMHFDFNYRVQGTVCYLMMMALLCGYMRIRNDLFLLDGAYNGNTDPDQKPIGIHPSKRNKPHQCVLHIQTAKHRH